MIKDERLWHTLVPVLALVVLFAASGIAAGTTQKPKASKSAKTVRKEAPPAPLEGE